MLRDLYPRAYRRYLALPLLGPLVEAFDTWAVQQGYRRDARHHNVHALSWIDRELRRAGRTLATGIRREDLEACWQRHHRRRPNLSMASHALLRFLAASGHLAPSSPHPLSPTRACVQAYAATLAELHGWAPGTIRQHARIATAFLTFLGYDAAPDRLAALGTEEVEGFLRATAVRLRRGSLQHTVAALRGVLRFLAGRGLVPAGLADQIDTPRCYREEQLPRAIPWETVRALLAAIDQAAPLGLRDYTLLFLVATYGLRACEVVTLTLDAIDWRTGVLQIPPRKRGIPLTLPLTDAVARVLIRYLRHGRPATPRRELFLRGRAPDGPLQPTAVSELFQAWVRRSGLPIPFQGPHCLRHATAVHLLRQGVSLKALGDLLGHRTAESTQTYLRLAVEDLRSVPLPVPTPRGEEVTA
jgi:site-specific recombinase XerD